MPIRTTSLTVTHPAQKQPPFGDGSKGDLIKLDKVLVTENTPSEDNSTYDDLTTLMAVTVHVMTPETPYDSGGTPIIRVGDTFDWNGREYSVTAVGNSIMQENIIPFLPFRWRFYGKMRTR